MAQDSLKSIFSLLHDYLYVADVFNLSCALAYPHSQWPRADVALVTRTLDVPPRVPLVRFLCTYMRRPRCRQCGKTCPPCTPVLQRCTRDDPGSPVLMVDRVYVVRTHRGVRGRKSRLHPRQGARGEAAAGTRRTSCSFARSRRSRVSSTTGRPGRRTRSKRMAKGFASTAWTSSVPSQMTHMRCLMCSVSAYVKTRCAFRDATVGALGGLVRLSLEKPCSAAGAWCVHE